MFRPPPGVTIRPSTTITLIVLVSLTESPTALATKNLTGVVNLNTAETELLGLLPGVGPSKAKSIIVYRARHSFRTVDELVRVKGIGRRMVRLLRSHLAVSGPSTARFSSASSDAAPVAVSAQRPVAKPSVARPVAGVGINKTRPPAAPAHVIRIPFASLARFGANHCRPPP